MPQRFRASSLVPPGLVVERFDVRPDRVEVVVRLSAAAATCPACGAPSRRVQSRYLRRAADLPLGGRRVELQVVVRRFRCDAVLCGWQIFAERFSTDVLPAFARRTGRLERVVHHLGLALGGRPGASLAERLMLPVGRDTLLRVVRRRAAPRSDPLRVIGIDDFAWRRNHRYGTLVCDLERRRPVTLLPDREQATAAAWLKERPSIAVVARPGRRLRRGCRPRVAARYPGRRPLAPDGERQPRLPRRGAPLHAPRSRSGRCGHH